MTNQSTEDIVIPDDLAGTLRWAATAVPGTPPDLAEVRQRRRNRQLRRSTAALAGVGVVVAASMVAPHLVSGPVATTDSATPAVTAEPTPPPPAPAQRLLLTSVTEIMMSAADTDWSGSPENPDPSRPNLGYPPGVSGIIGLGYREVTPSGEVVPLDVPGEDHWGFLALDDGRFVTLEFQSRSDEPPRDAPCFNDAALYLRVYESNGTMSLNRDVFIQCDATTLVGVSDTEVFLIRAPHDPQYRMPTSGRRLVAHNLADGTERTVADLDGMDPTIVDVSIGTGQVLAAPGIPPCQVQILDIASGVVRTLDLAATVGACVDLREVRLSPNGERLAITYANVDGNQPYDIMVAIVDLTGPTLRLREVADSLPALDPTPPRSLRSSFFPGTYAAGVAWTDDSTVRVAWVRAPEGLDRVIAVDDALDVQTYTVP